MPIFNLACNLFLIIEQSKGLSKIHNENSRKEIYNFYLAEVLIYFIYFQILFAIMCAVAASPQLFPTGLSPLLARDIPASEAPASTVHASHVAALTPALYYAAPYPYYTV